MRITAVHNAYDEESARNQVSGVWCETGGSLTQGCVVGGQQVFQQISPMSNGSTLPSLLGGNLAFYLPGQEDKKQGFHLIRKVKLNHST